MDFDLNALIELNRDPMLMIRDNKIDALNSAAQKLFRGTAPGRSAVGVIPDHILATPSDRFVSSAVIGGASYSAAALRTDGGLLLALTALEPDRESQGILSGALLTSLLSTLCSTGLAVDHVGSRTEGLKDEKLDEYLAILRHSYHTLNRLLSNLNAAVQLRRGCMDFSPRKVDLAKLCSDLVSTLSLLLSDREAKLEFSTAHGELIACVDAVKVERILLNLLSNSLSHTPADGTIRLGLSVSGGNAVLSVDDNGSGISEEVLRSIFTRYEERMKAAQGAEPSSGGLGLDISRGFAELHGGALIIESRPGTGTSVRVLLPLEQTDSFLESPEVVPAAPDMGLVLTELSGILSYKFYASEYMD
ncbi:MAG: sensor histidine kinase [Oscillospiraceae bacterium]